MKRLFAALAAFAALCAGGADRPSIETLFKTAQYRNMSLSPDGRTVAAIAPVGERLNLVTIDLAARKATSATNFTRTDVVTYGWINGSRLWFETGRFDATLFDVRGGVLLAVDADGRNMRNLMEARDANMPSGHQLRATRLVRTLPGETDDIIVQEWQYTRLDQDMRVTETGRPGGLFRLNTRTGVRTPIALGKPESGSYERWIVDSKGVARVFAVADKGRARTYYRAGEDADWKLLDDESDTESTWSPLAVIEETNKLVVTSRKESDKAAIVVYDPATKAFGEVLARHPQVDLADLRRTREGRIVGVGYEADRGGTAWFDEELAKVQASVDKALPDTVNVLSWSSDRQRFVITSRSDVLPATFYLLDRKTGRMEWLADAAPWIKPKEMAPVKPVRYAARDGLEIPAYLTLPRGSDGRNLPMVVVVHGGPWVEGYEWRFNPEVQFLASRGYAVLQPNFRGTTHYGWKHFHSSFGQWGLAMQDDIADGVLWAVKEGIADPKRVCIYGGSYGGYATMMGLAKNPELYRCGINYVGVTDLPMFLTMNWADYAQSDWLRYGAVRMVGDVDRDAERLKATSPTQLAARIQAPVFMAYGSEDRRVPLDHGTRMRSALEGANKKVQWMIGEGEGHGFRDPKNRTMFYGAMEKFLDENIGSKAAAAKP